jgi:hypothetical protein
MNERITSISWIIMVGDDKALEFILVHFLHFLFDIKGVHAIAVLHAIATPRQIYDTG